MFTYEMLAEAGRFLLPVPGALLVPLGFFCGAAFIVGMLKQEFGGDGK